VGREAQLGTGDDAASAQQSGAPMHCGQNAFFLALAALAWHPSAQRIRIVTVDKTELAKLEAYLRRTFSNHNISVRARLKKTDSAEVYLADEFIGIIHVDDEDGDRSFNFTMAILDVDLDD
jgi:hypothetical protein